MGRSKYFAPARVSRTRPVSSARRLCAASKLNFVRDVKEAVAEDVRLLEDVRLWSAGSGAHAPARLLRDDGLGGRRDVWCSPAKRGGSQTGEGQGAEDGDSRQENGLHRKPSLGEVEDGDGEGAPQHAARVEGAGDGSALVPGDALLRGENAGAGRGPKPKAENGQRGKRRHVPPAADEGAGEEDGANGRHGEAARGAGPEAAPQEEA